jgi:hypothetical protein
MSKRHPLPVLALCAAAAGFASTDASARGFGGGFGGGFAGHSVGGGFASRSFGGGFANRSFATHSFASRSVASHSVVTENAGHSHFSRNWHNSGGEGTTHTAQNLHAVTQFPSLPPGPGITQPTLPTRTPNHIPTQISPCVQNPSLCGLGTPTTPVQIPTKVNPCLIDPSLCGIGQVPPSPPPPPQGQTGPGPSPSGPSGWGPILTWKHHPHWWVDGYPVVIDGPVDTVVAAPVVADPVVRNTVVNQVATAQPGPCNCLTKQYLDDGSVLFSDICTREQALATPDELKAQAQAQAPLRTQTN